MSMIGEEKKIAFGTIFAFGSGNVELGRQVVDHMASRISINSVSGIRDFSWNLSCEA